MYNSNTYLQLRYPIVRHHRCSSRHLRHTPQSTRTHPRLKLVAMPRRSDSRTRVRHSEAYQEANPSAATVVKNYVAEVWHKFLKLRCIVPFTINQQ